MKQYFRYSILFCIILTFGEYHPVKADENYAEDELTLRNKLFANVFQLKEGVDSLSESVSFLDKRYSNQIDLLKELQTKFITVDFGDENVSDKMGSYFNATFRKYSHSENKIVNKLKEVQDEQTSRLDTILTKQNRKCGSSGGGGSSATLTLISSTVDSVNEKINKFEEQLKKLETLKEKFILQQTQMEESHLANLKVLQEINEKLTKNQEKFEKIEKDLPNLSELSDKMKKVSESKYPKLPMEFLLGLTTANMTKFN